MSSMGDQANFSISKNEVYTPVNVTSSTNVRPQSHEGRKD